MRLPLDRAVAASNATLFEGDAAPDTLRISTDTRSIEPGDTFVALHGERFDGHDFAAQAVQRGAALLVLDRPSARVAGVARDAGRAHERRILGVCAPCPRAL